MNKDEMLNKMDKTAEEAKKVLDSYDLLAKSLRTFYDNLIGKGFNEEQAFGLTQQYFDSMLRKFL